MKHIIMPVFLALSFCLVQCTNTEGGSLEEEEDEWTDIPTDLRELEEYILRKEQEEPVREDNHARILWSGSERQVSEYSFVYLHGFTGSYRDAYPVNVNVADTFDANIYLARWAGHGLKPPATMQDFSPEEAWESAVEALVIGRRIGRKVIIMSTSTGGTLAIKLAAEYPDSVFALINIAPNIEDDQMGAELLATELGPAIASVVALGDNREIPHPEDSAALYWDTIYPAGALVELQLLLSQTMNRETFSKVQCPVLTMYYYKNFFDKDDHVEVSSYPGMLEAFSTPDSLKKLVSFDTPKTHFIASDIKSQDYLAPQREIIKFCREILKME